jgi:hypothetical protein
VPSLINHINVAAKGVEVLLPTPTPSSTALVDKDPDKLLANAFIINKKIHLKIS